MSSNGNGDFHIGDRVVYPNHGVGIIEQIGSRTLGTQAERYYLLNIKSSNLKDRFKENSDRMRTGSLLEVAAVLKNLLVLKESKSLSFREKKMLERARYLLVSELALARNCEEAQVEVLLAETLAKTNLRFPEPGELEA
jgi:CarD family transcriptional regulator